MVDSPSPPTPPSGPHSPEEPNPAEEKKSSDKGFHMPPMTWMGMYFDSEEATKLWKVILQSVNSEIGKDKEKSMKALKQMRKSIEGDDDSG